MLCLCYACFCCPQVAKMINAGLRIRLYMEGHQFSFCKEHADGLRVLSNKTMFTDLLDCKMSVERDLRDKYSRIFYSHSG